VQQVAGECGRHFLASGSIGIGRSILERFSRSSEHGYSGLGTTLQSLMKRLAIARPV
jgi:hypothetical protein